MLKVSYVMGDVTNPQKEHAGPNGFLIAHLCNDRGVMGSGVALALFKRWPAVRQEYLKFFEAYRDNPVGEIRGQTSLAIISKDVVVANMIAMDGFGERRDHVDYEGVKHCLYFVDEFAKYHKRNVIMPEIGGGLAGGDFNRIKGIIEDVMTTPTFVYSLES